MDKPMYELELACIFISGTALFATNPNTGIFCEGKLIVLPVEDLDEGESRSACRDNLFAECNIPHHTDEAAYCLVCHVFNRFNHEPAIVEMVMLKRIAGEIVARYQDRFRPLVFVEERGPTND